MDHSQSVATRAPERYLLGEMTEAERFAFEAHYFECQDCADEVVTGEQLAAGSRAVFAAEPPRRTEPLRSVI